MLKSNIEYLKGIVYIAYNPRMGGSRKLQAN